MRWNAWVALVVAMIAGQALWIVSLRGPRILDHDSTLIIGQLVLGMAAIAIAGLIFTTPDDAVRLTAKQSRRLIMGGVIFLQMLGLFLLWPALSSDIVRYRLDGLAWVTGGSPYVITPRQMMQNEPVDAIDRTLPANDSFSIYPPVAQTVFIAARSLERALLGPARLDSSAPPDAGVHWRTALPYLPFSQRALILRLFFATAAVASVWVLLQMLEDSHRTPWLAVLFAWNPLLVLETAGSGHVDIVGILLLLVMLRMLQKENHTLATLALCLACGIKPMAVVLAPLLIRQISERHDWKIAQRSIGIAALTLAIVYGPILLLQHGYRGWIKQLVAYAQLREANGGVFTLLKTVFGEQAMSSDVRPLVLMLTPLVTAALLLWLLRRRAPMEDGCYWLTLCPLLVAPAAYPWAVLWPLCFVPMTRLGRGWTALTWSATAALAYAAWHQSSWEVPGRILLAEYAPVAVALTVELMDAVRQPTAPPDAMASA